MTAQQPEALRLRLAAEGHIALCKKFGPEGFHFDADPQDVLAILARMQELEAELASERRHSGASNAAAVRTLAAMGYSWHGGEQWKPPVTQAQQERKPLTDGEIIAAQERLIAAKDELYRSRIGLKCAHCKTGKYRADGNGYHDFHRCDSCRHVPMFGADGKEFGIHDKHG